MKRGLGVALLGALAWGLAAVAGLMLGGASLAAETAVAALVAVGVLALFGGLGRVAWLLLRR